MRSGMIFALLVLLPHEARSSHLDTVVIVDPGIYSARTVRSAERPYDLSATNTVDKITLRKSTTIVPAQKGIRFGFRYIVQGSPKGANVELRLAIKFPAPGLRAPGSSTTYLRNEVVALRTIGKPAYREFHFDQDWEMVPGLWTFEFWYGDRKVGEQRFCVVANLPEATAMMETFPDCPGTPVS